MSVRYSAWIWSAEHNRHYCCSYNEQGAFLAYHWGEIANSASSSQLVASLAATQVQAAPAPADQPRTPQAVSSTQSLGYNVSYSSAGAYTTAQSSHVPHVGFSSASLYASQQQSNPLPYDVQSSVGSNNPRRLIKTGDDGRDSERLDPRYARVTGPHIPYFFVRGRVFKMLWIEPAGQANPGRTRGSTHFSVVTWGETAYAEIRRFVVVSNKGNFSQCIPIQTYRKQGATKPGLLVQDHGVIFTGDDDDESPELLPGEGITKEPIRVESRGGEVLDPESRINFGKPYAVEHNVKVMDIGMVVPEHMHLLVSYFQVAMGISPS